MKSTFFLLSTALLLVFLAQPASAQSPAPDDGRGAWSDVAGMAPAVATSEPLPTSYRLLALDRAALSAVLSAASAQMDAAQPASQGVEPLLALPMPDGSYQRFALERSPVLEPQLAMQHPEIQTFRGRGVDDLAASVRLGLAPSGFHALILTSAESVYISPYASGSDALYMSYFAADYVAPEPFVCGAQEGMRPAPPDDAALRVELGALAPALSAGADLRTYRLALAATGEFAADAAARAGLVDPTEAEMRAVALEALAARTNLVNAIYEREVSIHFNLVDGSEQLIYVDAESDPYNNDNMAAMLGQNQAVVDALLGSANYDIGHVLGTAGGGIAYIGVACLPSYKAGGVSGSGAAVSAYAAMVTAHELGHQFDAEHTFNANSGSCGGGNRMGSSAYEPGSGSTIMSYAGLCAGGQNLPSYNTTFHVVSFDQIVSYRRSGYGATCGTTSATRNRPPSVNAGPDYTIPACTPFVLSGSASDSDGDPLAYGWQQADLPAGTITGTATLSEALADVGSGPLFRLYPLAAGGATRAFPARAHVLNGTRALGEVYPTTTRTLNFRLFTRDNRSAGGGANYDSVKLNVVDRGVAFAVTQPNRATTWPGGLPRSVTWTVAGTNAPPVACAAVDILLSADGGASFPTLLAAATPNDGQEAVALPVAAAAEARIQVRCSDNIFYNISPAFTITTPGASGALAGTVRDASGVPVRGATVAVTGVENLTVTSGVDGQYYVQLLAGTYALRITAYGYISATIANIAVEDGITTTRDVTLEALPQRVMTGTVRDAGHGYGLYATLAFTDAASATEAGRTWSDPATGVYSMTLYESIPYSVSVAARLPGFATAAGDAQSTDFVLTPDAGCSAQGYNFVSGQCTPVPGGLLVGGAYGPSGEPLAGVSIAGGSRSVNSAVTSDPAAPGAYYALFLPPGSQPITATGAYSGSALPALGISALITAGEVTQQDFNWQPLYGNAGLGNLSLSSGQLTPPFTSGVTGYATMVDSDISAITVLPVTSIPGAAVRANGMSVVSGAPSPPISLAVGENTITVEVTALDSVTTRAYRIIVTRAAPPSLSLYLPYVGRQ